MATGHSFLLPSPTSACFSGRIDSTLSWIKSGIYSKNQRSINYLPVLWYLLFYLIVTNVGWNLLNWFFHPFSGPCWYHYHYSWIWQTSTFIYIFSARKSDCDIIISLLKQILMKLTWTTIWMLELNKKMQNSNNTSKYWCLSRMYYVLCCSLYVTLVEWLQNCFSKASHSGFWQNWSLQMRKFSKP